MPKTDECPECGSHNTDFENCARCHGAGHFLELGGYEAPDSLVPCDDCGGAGGEFTCDHCGHVWTRTLTDQEITEGLEAQYDDRDF